VAFRLRHDPKAIASLDCDVQPAVVEAVEHVDDRGARANLAHAVVVGEHEPELVVALQAFADQLLVAQLEDVEGDALRRHQHDPQREEAELAHP